MASDLRKEWYLQLRKVALAATPRQGPDGVEQGTSAYDRAGLGCSGSIP